MMAPDGVLVVLHSVGSIGVVCLHPFGSISFALVIVEAPDVVCLHPHQLCSGCIRLA